MSDKGGKAVDEAPAGVELTTMLPEKISVDNSSRKTGITAAVKNAGSKDSGKIRLLVVGFDGLTVKNVKGCAKIPASGLPEGANSGFSCAVDDLAAGASKSYAVDATYDLTKQGKICLPVQTADGSKTYWQQGPVPFGASNPSPNAPATPLLLGTDNSPVTPGGDEATPGGGTPSPGTPSPGTPSPGAPSPGAPAGPSSPGKDELPRTGPADQLVPFGAAGMALASAGAAGLWWSRRRPARRT
ncbi:hypothetical protein GCM10010145_26860 [Streptomyces ruber]|uniref:LPXTG cell wall anchor domain-containing protein n=3 Tax=Streptomyces TaxID=1883 RepID=A0A918BBM0_9ACTN|nr:hypothetical protein GCM10010145_26860 [Streptomyces ruber]